MDDFKTMKETIQPVFAPMYKDEYERGFVEGRLSTVKSAVHRAVEGYGKMRQLTQEEISEFTHRMILASGQNPNAADINIIGLEKIVEDILQKAQEK
jgi:hypothetical protein